MRLDVRRWTLESQPLGESQCVQLGVLRSGFRVWGTATTRRLRQVRRTVGRGCISSFSVPILRRRMSCRCITPTRRGEWRSAGPAKHPRRSVHAAQWADGGVVARYECARRVGRHLVSRGLEERASRAHGIRASVRARHVPGLGARPKGEHIKTIEDAGGTMNGTTNNDRTNYFETVQRTTSRRCCGSSRIAWGTPVGRAHAGEARQPARRREERAALPR